MVNVSGNDKNCEDNKMKLTKYTMQCDMNKECKKQVTHIDHRGFIYCEDCAKIRKLSNSCRKLSSHEKKEIEAGKPLSRFKKD